MGEEPARLLRGLLRELRGVVLLEATQTLHASTLGILDRLRGCKLTYVDASSIALMQLHGIREVWGTDDHLRLLGARVTPGSHH
jgi:predicted nucleic acid-binding protein